MIVALLLFSVSGLYAQQPVDAAKAQQVVGNFEYVRFLNEYRDNYPFIAELYQVSKQENLTLGVIRFGNVLGVIARDSSSYARASTLHAESLELARQLNDTVEQIITLNNMGVVFRRQSRLYQATGSHMNALNLARDYSKETPIVKKSLGIALNSIGNINLSQQQYEKAIEFFKQAIKAEDEADSQLGMAINYNNIGEANEQLNRLDTALFYYRKSLDINRKIGSAYGMAICRLNIGNVFLKKGFPKNALNHYNYAHRTFLNSGDRFYIARSYINLGNAYLQLHESKTARSNLEQGLDIAREIGSNALIEKATRLLSEACAQTGNYAKAYDLYKTAATYHDSIINDKNSQYLTFLQTRYETEKNELEIKQLGQQHEIQKHKLRKRSFLLYGAIGFAVAAIIIIGLIAYQQKQRYLHRQSLLEQRLLRSQMNPHFIFNCLIAIQNFILKNQKEEASFFLGEFSNLTRSVLDYSRRETISLKEEAQLLKTYLKLQQMRFDFEYTLNIAPSIIPENTNIPPMLIQPFLENSIDHGLRPADYKGKIDVDITHNNNNLIVEITDNGIGIETASKSTSQRGYSSHSMRIFKERLVNFRRFYKNNINFEMVDLRHSENGQGTRVTFNIPINWSKR